MPSLKNRIGMLIGIACLSAGSEAHDVTIWPQPSGDTFALKLHLGDPGDYARIDKMHCVELLVIDAAGVKIDFRRDLESADEKTLAIPRLRLGDSPAGTYLVTGRYDNGLYVHDAENRPIATTREWYPEAIDSAHYLKFSKALFHIGAPSVGYDRIIGHRLEIVPLADPFVPKAGGALPVKVLFDGMPVKDCPVEVGDETGASSGRQERTDASGVLRIKLDHQGFYRLSVDHRAPSKYPALYAFDDYTASLVFTR
jgi:nickel transport protein